jgi:hypothetical protein
MIASLDILILIPQRSYLGLGRDRPQQGDYERVRPVFVRVGGLDSGMAISMTMVINWSVAEIIGEEIEESEGGCVRQTTPSFALSSIRLALAISNLFETRERCVDPSPISSDSAFIPLVSRSPSTGPSVRANSEVALRAPAAASSSSSREYSLRTVVLFHMDCRVLMHHWA